MGATYGKAIPIEKDFWILSEIYPKCREAERILNVARIRTVKIYKAHKADLLTQKKLAKVIETACDKNLCGNNKYENYQEQLEKLEKYYLGCEKKIEPRVKAVVNATKAMKAKVEKFKFDNAIYKAMKNKCDLIAYRMNKKKCKAVEALDASCSFYEACWKASKKVYLDD